MPDYLTHKDIEPILSRKSYPCSYEEAAAKRCAPLAMAIAIDFRETDDWDMIKGVFRRFVRKLSFGAGEDPARSFRTQDAG
ncbi:MAG: hypothetical protein ACOZEN_12480 [Thermodesulfobacteriota bacterium]